MLEGRIEALGGHGEGVLRHEGKVIFVPGALPGERVRAEIVQAGRRHDRGRLLDVLEPIEARRASPCPHDHPGGCGGCQLLIADPEAAGRWKTEVLRHRLEGERVPAGAVHDVQIAAQRVGYRNHALFSVVRKGRLAFSTRKEIPPARFAKTIIETCAVLHPLLDGLRGRISGRAGGLDGVELRAGVETGDRLVILYGSHLPSRLDPVEFDDVAFVGRDEKGYLPLKGYPWVHEVVRGVRLRISPGARFPASTSGAELLVATLRQIAGIEAGQRVLCVHAGGGLLALAGFDPPVDVTASETDPEVLADLRLNADEKIAVRAQRPEDALGDLVAVREPPDLIVVGLSPGGLEPETIAALVAMPPPTLIMHHQDTEDLAHDLRGLGSAFVVEHVAPLETLPGTRHLETLTRLRRDEDDPA